MLKLLMWRLRWRWFLVKMLGQSILFGVFDYGELENQVRFNVGIVLNKTNNSLNLLDGFYLRRLVCLFLYQSICVSDHFHGFRPRGIQILGQI